MFVPLSHFTIRNGLAEEVRKAFGARPHLEDAQGIPGKVAADCWRLNRAADGRIARMNTIPGIEVPQPLHRPRSRQGHRMFRRAIRNLSM
jgi:hypothetical protein